MKMNANFMDYFDNPSVPPGNGSGQTSGEDIFTSNFDFPAETGPGGFQDIMNNEQLRLSHFANIRTPGPMNTALPQQMPNLGNPRLQHYVNGHTNQPGQPMYNLPGGMHDFNQKNLPYGYMGGGNQPVRFPRGSQWPGMPTGSVNSNKLPTQQLPVQHQPDMSSNMMGLQNPGNIELSYQPLLNDDVPGIFPKLQSGHSPTQSNAQQIPFMQTAASPSPKFVNRSSMMVDSSPPQQCSPSFKPQFSSDSNSPALSSMMSLSSQSPSGFNSSQPTNLGSFPGEFSKSPQQHTPLSPKLSHFGPYPNKSPFDMPNAQMIPPKSTPNLLPNQLTNLGSPQSNRGQMLPSPNEPPMLSSPSPGAGMNMFSMDQRPRFPISANSSRPPPLGPAAPPGMPQHVMQPNLSLAINEHSNMLMMQSQQLQQMIRQCREHPSPQSAMQIQRLQAHLYRCHSEFQSLQSQQINVSMNTNQIPMGFPQDTGMGMSGLLKQMSNMKSAGYSPMTDLALSLPGSMSSGGGYMPDDLRLTNQMPGLQFAMDNKSKQRDRMSRTSSRSGSSMNANRKKKGRRKSSDSNDIMISSPMTPVTPIQMQPVTTISSIPMQSHQHNIIQSSPVLSSNTISLPESSIPNAGAPPSNDIFGSLASLSIPDAFPNAPVAEIAPLTQLARMQPTAPNLGQSLSVATSISSQMTNAIPGTSSVQNINTEPLKQHTIMGSTDSPSLPMSVPSPALSDGQDSASRRSLRERKKKNYKDDFDYNLSDDDEQKKAKEGLPINAPHKLIAYKPSDAVEGEIAIVEKILASRTRTIKNEAGDADIIGDEYYVKYKGYSYLHCEWGSAVQIAKKDKRITMKIKRYKSKHDTMAYLTELDDEPFNPDFIEIDRVLDMSTCVDQVTGEPVTHYLIKWMSLPYEDSTWELEVNVEELKIQEYLELKKPPPLHARRFIPRPDPMLWNKIERPPVYKNNNMLRNYQLEGLNWLRFCWFRRQNCILADEMGLGKTIQSISFLHAVKETGIRGPFLVIAPLSTISNWEREFETWSDINAIVYHGSASSRQLIQQYEMYYFDEECEKIPGVYKCETVITTYEMILNDNNVLNSIPWRCLIIDEAHRLKNRNCKLLEGLNNLRVEHSVLLTGTPLQNNVEELFSLLNFLEPTRFSNQSTFSIEFGNLKTESQVEKLQQILKPMMLRRLKEDVEKNIAPKEETIVEVELTTIQKKFYRAILERNFSFLSKGSGPSSNLPNLMNTMMELRKCCNHPFLINGAEERIATEYAISADGSDAGAKHYQAMIESSGKMVLIDKLLAKLKIGGHKVLIFSQMIKVLDLIEDYLIGRRYLFERIDGRVRGNVRQAAIDRFSRPDSDRFVFLLCTRAGGLGINLTAADTVIIFDSDWNPQNDLQAQARCHRIGQQKSVKVYRLVCRNTYEREMFDRASLKLGLDRAVLQNMNAKESPVQQQPSMSKKEVEDLLKRGAYGALMDEDNADSTKFCEEDIDQILERRTQVVRILNEGKGSTFAKASFVSEKARVDVDLDDPDFWQKWAKKASIEVGDTSQDRHLIMDKPRQRKQTKRFGNEDGSVELSDIESEEEDEHQQQPHDASVPSRTAWTRVECFKVEKNLLIYGWGRWREIIHHGHFRQELNYREAESIACSILVFCYHHFKGDERTKSSLAGIIKASITKPKVLPEDDTYAPSPGSKIKAKRAKRGAGRPPRKIQYSKPALVEAGTDWKTVNPETLIIDAGYRKHLIHHCNKIVLRVRLLYCLKTDIIGEFADTILSGTPAAEVPINHIRYDEDAPASWWDRDADRSLVIGVFKHGYESYHLLKADPTLCFALRFGSSIHMDDQSSMPSPYALELMSMERFDDSNDALDSKKRKRIPDDDEFNSDDASMKEDDDLKDLAALAASPAPSLHTDVGSMHPKTESSSSVDWPSVSEMNTRLRRIVSGFIRGSEKEHQKLVIAEKDREKREKLAQQVRDRQQKRAEMAQKWSRREETDFYRVVSSFGVVFDTTTESYDWSKFRQLARLDKKDNDRLTHYFNDFMAMCRRVCHKATDEDLQNTNKSHVEPITEERANRCLQRVQLLRTIREKVLPHKQLSDRIKLCQPSSEFPSWWKPGVHDRDLLIGVSRHGIGRTDYHLFTDPELAFKSVLDAACITKSPNDDTPSQSPPPAPTPFPSDVKLEESSLTDEKGRSETPSTNASLTPPISNSPVSLPLGNVDSFDDGIIKIPSLPPSITPEAAEMLSMWPKDRIIINRLQKICHCILNGFWHKGGKLESIVSKLQPQLLHVQPPTLCRSVAQAERKGLIDSTTKDRGNTGDVKLRGNQVAMPRKESVTPREDTVVVKKTRKRRKKETVVNETPLPELIVPKSSIASEISQKILNKIMKNSKPMAVVSPTIDTTKPKREKRKRKATPINVRTAIVPMAVQLDRTSEMEVKKIDSDPITQDGKQPSDMVHIPHAERHHHYHHHHHHHHCPSNTPPAAVIHVPQVKKQASSNSSHSSSKTNVLKDESDANTFPWPRRNSRYDSPPLTDAVKKQEGLKIPIVKKPENISSILPYPVSRTERKSPPAKTVLSPVEKSISEGTKDITPKPVKLDIPAAIKQTTSPIAALK